MNQELRMKNEVGIWFLVLGFSSKVLISQH